MSDMVLSTPLSKISNFHEFLLKRDDLNMLVIDSEAEFENLFFKMKKISFYKTKFHNENQTQNGWNKEHLGISRPESQSISMGDKNQFSDTRRDVESNYLSKPSNPFPKNKADLNHSKTTSISGKCSNDVSKQLRHLNNPINIILMDLC